MNIRFYRDPATSEPHIYNHGVTEEEVDEVIRRPGEDRRGREGSRVAIGQTRAGKSLRVIYVPDPEPDSISDIPQCLFHCGEYLAIQSFIRYPQELEQMLMLLGQIEHQGRLPSKA
jgi:hypothetical protein